MKLENISKVLELKKELDRLINLRFKYCNDCYFIIGLEYSYIKSLNLKDEENGLKVSEGTIKEIQRLVKSEFDSKILEIQNELLDFGINAEDYIKEKDGEFNEN